MERERLEALADAENARKEKHAKMEREREGMRQGIRDKVILIDHTLYMLGFCVSLISDHLLHTLHRI